jgi:hypothetical protein
MAWAYETYQDVRRVITYYATGAVIVVGLLAYLIVVPPAARDAVEGALMALVGQPVVALVGPWASVGVVSFVIAWLLFEVLKVHDRHYDRHVIHWRRHYAVDFILPRLVRPFGGSIDDRFLDVAADNLRDFQESLYYPYVGDRHRMISQNKLVRFYEAVAPYWFTQVNEILIGLLVLGLLIARLFGGLPDAYWAAQTWTIFALAIAFVLNRWAARALLGSVRRATADEIAEIHEKHTEDLKRRVEEVCARYGLRYRA